MYSPFTHDEIHHLPTVISAPRFATYLQASANDREQALKLYHWNLQVSSAFIVPLHIAEVALRNAIVDAIESVHGGAWPWTTGFIRSLTDPTSPSYSPKRDLNHCARRHPTAGKVVADLRFVFWEKMLTRRHQRRLWDHHFFTSFPHAPPGVGSNVRRGGLRSDVEKIRSLRNRIAHHEPIFSRALQHDLALILESIRWINETAATWVEEIETVSAFLAVRP